MDTEKTRRMLEASVREKERWLAWPGMDSDTKEALLSRSEEDILDRFHCRLAFGTGGLRGVLGVGTNRMNRYTVRHATQGLANHMNAASLPKRAAIAYDSRIGSELFAKTAAGVLAANGVQALIYPRLEPTPALSWAVRDLECGAGICITASHNPAQYNGYKVYGPDGCQITLEAAQAIEDQMERLDVLEDVSHLDFQTALGDGRIQYIQEETLDRYLAAVRAQSLYQGGENIPLRVVYTPLNGTGLECVTRILGEISATDVHLVQEQAMPDGRFSTCPYPNPEIREALTLGLEECLRLKPDLLLATDPDCDRVGVAVPRRKGYALLSGNEVGVLLLDYICKLRGTAGRMPAQPVAVTTIVSSAMATRVAEKYGVELWRTLTGFKFIGEQIGLLEKAGQAERFVFGFEESNGYLSGTHVRDKDGVNAAMLICEMARWHKGQGRTLWQAMEQLYREFGYHHTALHSFSFPGAEGMEKRSAVMEALRDRPPKTIGGKAVVRTVDYGGDGTGLPKANVLEFQLADDCKLMIRPSGTEPKMKAYVFTAAPSMAGAMSLEKAIYQSLKSLMA